MELEIDKDQLRQGVRDIPRAVGSDADRAGREMGDKMGSGLAAAVEQWSGKVARARRAEVVAADAVKLAELRLNEAREDGNKKGSALLALEQKLSQAKYKLADANSSASGATNKLADAQKRLAAETAAAMANIGDGVGPAATRAGDDAGGKLALGMRMSIIRNSPLIVAAVGAALAVGAPAALAAATGLFAGIGIAAATQSAVVRSSWVGTWQSIRTSAVQDAKPIEAVLVGLADRVEGRFAQMRPQLAGIFVDVAPQIDVLAGGLLDLADNALPGFERAIDRGMPVARGFASLLASAGTSVSGFFDGISRHAPAAGRAFELVGGTLEQLMPLLGELLGQGAELATVVLPVVNGSLGITLGVVRALGPAFPPLVAGILALKVAQTAAGWLGGLGTAATNFGAQIAPVPGVMGKMNAGLSAGIGLLGGPWGAALAGAAALMAIFTADINKNTETEQRWAESLRKGGDDAKRVMAEAAAEANKYSDNWFGALSRTLDQWAGLSPTVADAEQANKDYWATLDPVTAAEEQLAMAIANHGAKSDEAKAAQANLNQVTHEATRAQEAHELALNGVTQAMIDQLDQIRAAADAEFAHRQAVEASSDAFTTYNEAIRDHGRGSEEAADAAMAFEGALRAEADAAGRLATESLPATASETEKLNATNVAHLGKLLELERKYGADLPAAMQREIQSMQGSMTAAQRAGAEFASLGLSILSVPNSKTVIVSSTTPEQQTMLEKLGFTVTHLPDKTVQITANTAQAEAAMNHTARPRSTVIYMNGNATHAEQVGSWSARTRQALITAGADVANAERHLAWVARNRTVRIWTNVSEATGGPVIKAAGGRKVIGPGGPTDDLVPAIGPGGASYSLSNGEWIINAAAVTALERAFGAAIMPMINRGQLPIEIPPPRGFATGGTPRSSSWPMASMDSGRMMAADQARAGGVTIYGGVSLVIPGAYNLGTGEDKRRLLEDIRAGLLDLDRELR